MGFPIQDIASAFSTKKMGVTLFAFQEIPSTNTFAMGLIQKDPVPGTLIVADHQTDGRGRLNRPWFSPPGVNIYASLILRHTSPPQLVGWIPLLSGLAIGQTIEESVGHPIELKWPNDLLVRGKKLGGILCETAADSDGKRWFVIGFGINVNESNEGFPQELSGKVTSLQRESGHPWDRFFLLQKISTSLEDTLTELDERTITSLKTIYRERCTTIGQRVQVSFPDGSHLTGIAHSIGSQGQLQLSATSSNFPDQFDRMVEVHSGDVSHVRPA